MEETKRCPYCGGEIMAVAKKCKHCGKWLDEVDSTKVAPTKEELTKEVTPKQEKEVNVKKTTTYIGIGCLAIILLLLSPIIYYYVDNAITDAKYEKIDELNKHRHNEAPSYTQSSEQKVEESKPEPVKEELSEEDALRNRVSAIFNDVYSGKVKGNSGNWEKKYFTDDFYDVYTMVQEHDAKYHQGEIGFLDYDIWTKSQDYADDISAMVSTVSLRKDHNDNDFADVVVNINNGSSKQQLNLTMLKVGDEWYIDSMDGLKSSMKTYLATD